MIYRKLKKADVEISIASFGSMRWDSEEACYEVMNRGMDLGMNYVDTSSGYIGGQSLVWTGRAVRDRRSEILFACKSDWASAPSEDEVRKSIESALEQAGLDYFDFYQLWGLMQMDVLEGALRKGGTIDGIHKAMGDGLVKHGPGFTFHGPPEVFRAAVDSDAFLCATVSYNLMNRKDEELLNYAAERGVGTVIMNPLAGGVLGMGKTEKLNFLHADGSGAWYGALRFLFANRSITTAILGMSTPDQVEQNLSALEGAEALDEEYRLDLARQMDAVEFVEGQFCTQCGYCKVCEEGFETPRLMGAMRDYVMYGVQGEDLLSWLRAKYVHRVPEDEFAKCVECGKCQEKCPQELPIVDEIRKAKALFGVE